MSYWLIEMSAATKLCQTEAHALKQFLIGLRADGPVPAPPARYVVRAETPDGPLYLLSLTGSCSEWTSEQRYAYRFFDKTAAHVESGEAFCPDATSVSVRRLVPGAGYHISISGFNLYVAGEPDDGVSAFSKFERRRIFRTRGAAERWIEQRKALGGGFGLRIVPESPESPESPPFPIPGGAAQ